MKPFVILQTRPEDIASEGEYESFLELGNLKNDDLIRVRLDKDEFWKMDLDSISGIILPGSPFNPGTKTPHEKQKEIEKELFILLDRVLEADFPFLSICYGMGLIGLQAGAKVSEKFGEKLNVIDVNLTDAGKNDKLLKGVKSSFQSIVGHKVALEDVPGNATLLATGEKSPIQMLKYKNNIYTTQFHPELNTESVEVRIKVYVNHGYFPPHKLEEILEMTRGKDYSHSNKIVENFIQLYHK
ncbi:MAG: glutamine amidotransferase [Bifidobacteriaceae bacterium]|jgi:GMP synthase (glutamine-hydrolysing)|nr:glutamine amidotransferase [Bifidobacteriaceae bacterium]